MVRRNRKRNSKIIVMIITVFFIALYLLKGNSLYEKKEIRQLNEENNNLQKKLEEIIIERDKLLLKNKELTKTIEELQREKNIEEKYGLVKLKGIDPTFIEDLRYATENNFLKRQVYPDNSIAILRKDTAMKLKRANEIFKKEGYTIKILDAYRPQHVQYKMWEYMPNTNFIANPDKGSKHNRGAAVDITLVDKDRNEIEMGTEFDNFTEKAAYNYPGHTEKALKNMKYLRNVMEQVGFKGISNEWWHFDDVNWKKYEVLDIGFDEFD